MAKPWKCPVCGFIAKDETELDEHIKKTGHVMYDDTDDKGTETPKEPNDLEYSDPSAMHTPGVSSGDVHSNEPDLESKKRIQGKEGKQ